MGGKGVPTALFTRREAFKIVFSPAAMRAFRDFQLALRMPNCAHYRFIQTRPSATWELAHPMPCTPETDAADQKACRAAGLLTIFYNQDVPRTGVPAS